MVFAVLGLGPGVSFGSAPPCHQYLTIRRRPAPSGTGSIDGFCQRKKPTHCLPPPYFSTQQGCCQCIMKDESSGNANAMNYNTDSTFDVSDENS